MSSTTRKKTLDRAAADKNNASQYSPSAKFYCCTCGTGYSRQKGYFPVSHSRMYRGSGFIPVCNDCIENLFEYYTNSLGSEKAAMKRLCMKMDLYWSENIFDIVDRTAGLNSKVRSYIQKTNIIRYIDKSYDDTLKEEARLEQQAAAIAAHDAAHESESYDVISEEEQVVEEPEEPIAQEIIEFWGPGFTRDLYCELDQRYHGWTKDIASLDPGEIAIYKQICILEATINRDSAAGKAIDKSVNALNNLLGSANLKPTQKKFADLDAEFDSIPFGVGIAKYEERRPIPEPDPDLSDVDNVVRFVETWLKGHLCKMLGIKNSYSRLYEQEIAKYRVTRPEYEDEDDEDVFNDIFANGAGGEDADS